MGNTISAGGFAPAHHIQERPFDELKLSKDQIQAKMGKLITKGYFFVKMSQTTAGFLKAQSGRNERWEPHHAGKTIDFIGAEFEKSSTEAASRIVAEFTGKDAAQRPQEFELRRPNKNVAEVWHQDNKPKELICLATIDGRGTEYVLPGVAKKVFEEVPHTIKMKVLDNEAVVKNTQEAKRDRFYFFAGRGIADSDIPKLVHRAPDEGDRTIFMARWTSQNHPSIFKSDG